MSKFFYLLLISCFGFGALNAQTWNRRFSDDLEGTQIVCRNISKVDDGYLLFLIEQKPFTLNDTSYYYWNFGAYKLDEDGNLLSRKYYNDSLHSININWADVSYTNSDGDILFAGFYKDFTSEQPLYGEIIKFNSLGDTLWTRLYGDGLHDHGLAAVRPTADGGMIAVGSAVFTEGYPKNWALRLDADGNEIWSEYFGQGMSFRGVSSVQENEVDGFFVVAGYEDVEDLEPGCKTWKLNASGAYLDAHAYSLSEYNNDSAEGLLPCGNGEFLWCGGVTHEWVGSQDYGQHVIAKIGSDLDTLWTTEFGASYNMQYAGTNCIIPDGNNQFVCAGSTGRYQEYDSFSQGHITKFNGEGEIAWHRVYEVIGSGYNSLFDIVKAPDGGYVAAGWTLSIDTEDERFAEKDAWVIKVDSMGCLVPGCATGILDQEETVDFNIYPNPSNEYAFINFQTTDAHSGIFKLMDLEGKMVREFSAYRNTQFILETAGLSNGEYILEFLSENNRVTRKLIVCH